MAMNNNALARHDDHAPARANPFEPSNLGELMRFADYIAESELVPKHLRGRPRDIVLIAVRSRELGIPMLAGLSMIYLVEGRVSLSAELWVAIVKRHPDCEYFRLVESTTELATYECKRRGAAPSRLTYTIAQATAAGLAGKSTWRQHAASMLRARSSSALARAEFPDAALGMLEQDEAEEITGHPSPVAATVEVVSTANAHAPHPLVDAMLLDLGESPTVWEAASVWRKHRAGIIALGDADAQHEAQNACALAVAGRKVTAAEWRDVLAVLDACEAHPVLADFVATLTACPSIVDVAKACVALKSLGKLPADVAALAWTAAVRRAGELEPGEKQPQAALKRAMAAKPTPEGPKGGGAPKPAATVDVEADEERAAIASEPAAGSVAQERAAFVAYLATKEAPVAVENAVAACVHERRYPALGDDAVKRAGMNRWLALACGAGRDVTEMSAATAISAAVRAWSSRKARAA